MLSDIDKVGLKASKCWEDEVQQKEGEEERDILVKLEVRTSRSRSRLESDLAIEI